MVDELGRDWAVDQRWTVKTFNRGRTCKAVCKYHMELCMTIETCPRVYGCDDAKRSRHGPVKKGEQCQRVFKVYPGEFIEFLLLIRHGIESRQARRPLQKGTLSQ